MNPNFIEISLENNSTLQFVKEGATLYDLLVQSGLKTNSTIIAAYVDNHIKELSYRLFSQKSIRFISLDHSEGRRVYARSLFFLLQKAATDINPATTLRMMHPVGRGYYCEIDGKGEIPQDKFNAIVARMRELVQADIPIVRQKINLAQAKQFCIDNNIYDKLSLLNTRPQFYLSFFNLAGHLGYFYGAMVPSTGFLKVFDLAQFGDGAIVMMPNRIDHQTVEPICLQPKLYEIFQQNKSWVDKLNIANIGELNQQIIDGKSNELIQIGEALQEKNFSMLADVITAKHHLDGVKIVLIAGPSSSGKTTSSKRLSIQLRVLGLDPQPISLDDYFVERDKTPLDADGNRDFEALEAIDIKLFNDHLLCLLAGEKVTLPHFSFKKGTRSMDGPTLQMNDNTILIIEGIHGLNPALVPQIHRNLQYKVYTSALTALSVDNTTAIHTTDNRLLRRMVRDHNYRGRSAYETLKGWESVRRGEDRNIFPYQEQADTMFNTALFYELSVIAPIARPLLTQVPPTSPEYAEALRLLKFLNYFIEMPSGQIPPNSIIREFIGGSSFEY